MALSAIPVVMPYRVDDGQQPPIYNCQVEAVASSKRRAIATANTLLRASALLHHQAPPQQTYAERVSVGQSIGQVEGPYGYVFTRSDRIPHLTLPNRIDGKACDELADTLASLNPGLIYGMILDLAPLAGITTRGLSTLVEHGKRLNMHIFRVPPNVRKVITITGLHHHLFVHDDIIGALEGCIRTHRRRQQRSTLKDQPH